MYNIEYFENLLKTRGGKVTVSVIAPYDQGTVESIEHFRALGILDAILVGEAEKMDAMFIECGIDKSNYTVITANDLTKSASEAIKVVAEGKADFLMKGLVDTSIMLKEFLKKEHNLRTTSQLSHVSVLYQNGTENIYLITDAGMNISPGLEEKKQIIENAVSVAHAINMDCPNVAMLCAKEKVYDKMPATVDAAALQKMNQDGEITGCVVSGPLQIDNAVSIEAATLKGVKDPVAGKANIFVVPDINSGNIFCKALVYLAGYTMAGLVVGGKVPIVLASRADGKEEKIVSLSLAIAKVMKERG